MRKYCNSTDIHPRRQMDGSMATEKPLSSPARCCEPSFGFQRVFYSAGKAKSFHEAKNSNINRCTSKINIISHTCTIGMVKMKTGHASDVWWELQFCSTWWLIQMPEQTISKRDNTWLFQVCKHLISCILQCAIRDHLGHICCKLKHFKVEATLCRKTRWPTQRRRSSRSSKA